MTQPLYSLNSAYPAPLPHIIYLSDGRPRSSQQPFTAVEISDAGYIEAPKPPAYDPATHSLGWDGEGWVVTELPPPPPPSSPDINAERDRRVSAGTTVTIDGYGPVPLQGRDQDQTNLLGLVTAANLRVASGDTTTTTKFRDATNTDHMLTPSQIVEMWSKGSAWISAVYDASWAIKAMDPIPADYADDSRWP